MLKLGVRCVRRAVSGADLTDFGKAVRVSLLLVLSCVLSPAFAQVCPTAGGSGSEDDRWQVATLCQLQGISTSPTAHYELVADIDASTATDFSPIATFSGSFVNTGKYEISSLTISRSDAYSPVGLFSVLARDATIRGVILVDSHMTGRDIVGSLVGFSEGVIEDSSALGSVSGGNQVGGLVGLSEGSISNSYATGSVSGQFGVGGLVGHSAGEISGNYTASTVTGTGFVGGLVGGQDGSSISNSYATGSVSGQFRVGGLVGWSRGNINYGYATGSVSGDYEVGGLVGQQESGSRISYSYATGSVSGDYEVGGLVGWSRGNINNGYATGSVSGQKNVGGLTGVQGFNSSIRDSYATGSVFGTGDISNGVGGLVGYQGGSINNTYATGSVSGNDQVGGLVGFSSGSNIGNSYYAVRGRNNGLGEERTFAQLRCPTMSSKTCPSGSQESALSYEGWDTNVWDFGSATDLPQLSINRNPELNRKPYIESSTELVVGTGFTGVTQLSLEADYPGSPGEPVALTWSLLFDEPPTLSNFFYFVLEDGTTSTEAHGSSATLAVVGDDNLTAGRGFYIVLKNNVSANDDRILVQTEEAPYIFRNDTVSARIGSTATFSFSVGYERTPGKPVALTWSLSGVPSTLRHLVYFDLGGGTTSTTFTDPGRFTDDASVVTLVVVGNEELAGRRFYVELKNNISANNDRILIQTVEGQPYILLDDDIDPATTRETTTFSFSVGYTGSPDPVTLTWSLSDVPPSLNDLVYFDLGGGTTSTTFTDTSVLTNSAGTVTLVVVGNEGLAGNGFYVELKNNTSDSVDRIPVRIAGASPLVAGRREQTGMIWDGSTRTILRFSATDPDSPGSGGAGLSWGFSSTDRITMGSAVVFSGSQTGGIVEVEVVRPSLDFYGVGSFVLEVESPAGVKTMVTVTIETVCSLVPGEDLMAGQTGKGTLDDRYQIKRLCQLQDISSSPTAHYELVNDMDASRTRDWNDGAGFEPIASGEQDGFMGSFVSTGNYEISSLTINRVNTNDVGLFSKLAEGAMIEGVILVGSRTTGSYSVGSLVGFNNGGVIEDSSATGYVFGEYAAGGLVGWNNGNINNGYAMGSVLGVSYGGNVGGLVGYHEGSISDSSATGSVSGGNLAGGLVGHQGPGASIRDSYAAGSVSGQIDVGGLVGFSEGSVSNSSASGLVSGQSQVGGLVGSSGGSVSDSSAAGSVLGTGGFSDNIGGLVGRNGVGASVSRSRAASTVTGNDHVGGLVGLSEGSVSDSYATGSVSGESDVGGLVGDSRGGISDSYATGSVDGQNSVGGLVGTQQPNSSISDSYVGTQQPNSSISDSYATGTVDGQNSVGGLVGYSAGSISRSYASSTATGTGSVGGLVGRQGGNSSISDSYASGLVSGQSQVGGLVGHQESNSSISDSYAASTVTGNDYVGGLVGSSEGSISNTFAVSTVSTVTGTTTRIGGLVGFSESSEGSIVNSYYTGQDQEKGWGERRTLVQLSCPTAPDAMCPLPTDLVTYAGWDRMVWDFGGTDDLPQLLPATGGSTALTRPLRVKVYLGGAVR